MKNLRKTAATLALIVLVAGATSFFLFRLPSALAQSVDLEIQSKVITNFRIGDVSKTRFGALRFISGIQYWSDYDGLGGISGVRILDGGAKFLSVSDKGQWFSGSFKRDISGKIIGISEAKMAPLLNEHGKVITSKKHGDAEGLEIFGDKVLVSFERKSRIYKYKLDLEHLASTPKLFRPAIRKIKLPYNKGLEAISILEAPDGGKLSKARIAVFSEKSLDKKGNIRGFVSKKKKWRKFSVKAKGDYNITDALALSDGYILILERQFSMKTGAIIRIRKILTRDIRPGAIVDGDIIFTADSRYQIDNLEGMSSWVNENGQTILTIVSDNNFSFLQRNLMLEFELMPGY